MVPFKEALQEIREACPSNPDILDDLKARLSVAEPIPLLPFVGAGLSVPMGFPSWRGFLEGRAGECGKTAEVAKQLDAGEYEEAAETVEVGLGEAVFGRRIAHRFGERKSEECKLQGAVLALPDLAGGAVVTTNFDRVLERVFQDAGSPFEHVVWGAQVDSMRGAIADNKPFLLKIHGDAEERTGRVLTKTEYDRHYAPGDPNGLRAQLGRLFQGRRLLFVGCSLGADRTMDVLSEVLRGAAGGGHFAIVEKPAEEAEFFKKQKRLGDHEILPIWYPTDRHDLIEPLLRWMANLRPGRPGAGPDLALERPSQKKKEIRSELDLLIPYQRTTALVGRQVELESLQEWVRSEAAALVRVVTGGGGAGKTRLAVELLEWLEETEPGRWNVGFLTQAEMDRFSGLQNLSQWRRRRPVLAVVDYAAGSAERLRVWLEQLAAAPDGGAKLRLLLLEREASAESGWLSSTIARGYSERAVRDLFDPPEPVRLHGVAAAVDRRTVLRATVEAGAARRGVAAPTVPEAVIDAWFDRRLGEPEWGDPLTLMMAGLTALDTGLVAAMALGRADLALRLAERECERVERFGKGTPAGLMSHMAACVTVSGGLSREELKQAAREETEAIGRTHPAGWGVLADAVAEALAGDGGVRAVQPDIVGEALLLRVWGDDIREGCQAVVRAANRRGQQVAASVMRTAQDFCVGAAPRKEPLVWLDGLIEAGKNDFDLLMQIEGELPLQTLALRERAVEVDALLASALRTRAEADLGALPLLARTLSNLGVRLSALGRREEALAATEEAAGIYRQLDAQRPDAFLPDLAGSLNNLGSMLSDLGRREEALAATEEAVRLRRQLAARHPDAFLPDLAGSLNNLGTTLSELGRWDKALEASEEAVRIYRQLAVQRPEPFLPYLALSLSNLGGRLSDLGRREEALETTEKAVQLRRQLAAQRPDAYRPNLATSLNNLGGMLSDLGRRERALEASEEAIRIYRQLAAQHAEAFLPNLAGSLSNLGGMLSDLGRREKALEASEEAVRIYRQLAAQHPEAFLPDLAMSFNNLGNRLSELGRWDEALAASEEAVRIRRQLAARHLDAFLPALASSLNNLGKSLSEMGRREEALKASEEAVSIRRQLAAQRPEAFLPDLASALHNLGVGLSELGRRNEALAATEETVRIRRQLAAQRPDAFLPDLAMSVNNLGGRLIELGRWDEALAASKEAVEISRRLSAQGLEAFLPDLARALGTRGAVLWAQGEAAGAAAAFKEGMVCLKPLFLREPAAFVPFMTNLVAGYVQTCQAGGVEVDSRLLSDIMPMLLGGKGEGGPD